MTNLTICMQGRVNNLTKKKMQIGKMQRKKIQKKQWEGFGYIFKG